MPRVDRIADDHTPRVESEGVVRFLSLGGAHLPLSGMRTPDEENLREKCLESCFCPT